jgi:SAM-dependent methyltransferase
MTSPPSQPEPSRPFDPVWYAELAAKEDAHFWFRARARLIVHFLRRHLPGMRDFTEFGCGTGHALAAVAGAFPDAALLGTEYFEEALPFARARVPRARFAALDLLRSEFDSCFDAVGAFDVLEHIEDDLGALRSMARSLRPGGIAVITVPQHRWLWSWQDECSMHFRRYSRRGLRELAARAGLEPVEDASFTSLLLPAMALSRRGRPGAAPDPMAEFRLPPALGWSLWQVMRAEAWLVSHGVRFPAGGSLLLVARRPATGGFSAGTRAPTTR